MPLEIRAITPEEVPAFRDAIMTTFGDDAEVDPDGGRRLQALLDPARIWAAFDAGTIVATAASFDHAVGLPGGTTLPMAGLTMVSVRPSHRRRGLLRQLMARYHDDARARGYALEGLWASEASIYGRFGYGIAAHHDAIEITDAGTLGLDAGDELDDLEWIDEARAREVLPDVYARVTADRPGALRRSDVWWHERRFLEAAWTRRGASRQRHVLARRGAEVSGYLAYRQRGKFDAGLPAGQVEIVELIASDVRAELTLWKFALSIDLFPTVRWGTAPLDCPLPWRVDNPRRVGRRRADNLWLRLEDIGTALAARRYGSDGTLRLACEDTIWELAVDGGVGSCRASTRDPELHLGRAALGPLYLGGTPASVLARAGLVRGTPSAVAAADRMFASSLAPWCPEVF